MIRYEIREICGDWAIHEVRETETEGGEQCLLILNSRANAEYIKAILEHEAQYPNAAVPFARDVEEISDEEAMAMLERGLEQHRVMSAADDDKEKKRKKPSLAERVLRAILFTAMAVPLLLLWMLVYFVRFPFRWIGKIDDVLDDAERGINRFVTAIGEYIAAITPECEWKYQYEKLKKQTEVKSNENISD